MTWIKIAILNSNTSRFISSNSLSDLKQKAENTFGIKIDKVLRAEDSFEVDDEDVFQELIKVYENKKDNYLQLILVEKKESFLSTKLIDHEKNRLVRELNKDKIKTQNLKALIEDDEVQNLNAQYKRMVFETLETKQADQKDMKKISKRIDNLHKQNDLDSMFAIFGLNEKIDFCFLIDCTSSMSTYIEQVHESINEIVDRMQAKYGSIDIRFCFVGYRDFSEFTEQIISIPFIEDIELFKTLIGEIETFGGGDECEDVFGGIFECTKIEWTNPVRILFHLCDAPCHGLRFHGGCEDFYPKGDPNKHNIKDLLVDLCNLNVHYYFAQINPSTLKMVEEFNKELSYYQIKSLKLIKNMADLVTHSINESIVQTTRVTDSNFRLKVRNLTPLDWSNLSLFKKYKADYFSSQFLSSLDQQQVDFVQKVYDIYFCEKPFSKGVLRYAYPCIVNIGGDCNLNCVVKDSVYTNPEFTTVKYHEDCVRIQLIAGYLAHKFSEISKEFKIRFLDVDLIRVHETGVYYSIEEFVEGEFIKWMNNDGNSTDDENSRFLSAFSHWTYEYTREYLLVTDLQGFVFKDREFILTDPAIICPSEPSKFGRANLGAIAIENFFRHHLCNEFCIGFNLKNYRNSRYYY